MRTNNALQMIFAFFLGLVVVAFVGIGVNTFYPEPSYADGGSGNAYLHWRLATGIILLACATALLVISLVMPEVQAVLSNGVLLGGVFTMVYAVGVTLTTDRSVWRFVVVAIALAVTVGVGYLKFVRSRRHASVSGAEVDSPPSAVPNAPAPAAAPTGPSPFAPPLQDSAAPTGAIEDRLAAVERRLDAVSRALRA
jgi:hypothetical protein